MNLISVRKILMKAIWRNEISKCIQFILTNDIGNTQLFASMKFNWYLLNCFYQFLKISTVICAITAFTTFIFSSKKYILYKHKQFIEKLCFHTLLNPCIKEVVNCAEFKIIYFLF